MGGTAALRRVPPCAREPSRCHAASRCLGWFFFSSRRRHTRFKCDWSSDVCSSDLFSLDPSSPNALAGRKRPLHTIIPAFAQKGEVRVAFGIMGGWNQSQAHAQFVANLVDFKMNIQAALEAPRFSKHTFGGCDVMMENRLA